MTSRNEAPVSGFARALLAARGMVTLLQVFCFYNIFAWCCPLKKIR